MPRTGTSYLCDCLGTLPGVMIAREIFNPRGYGPLLKFGDAKERFEAILGRPIEALDDPGLHQHFLEHPLEGIATLADAAADKRASVMVYKVIQHQLERAKLEAILNQRRPDVLVLVRHRLDIWISIVLGHLKLAVLSVLRFRQGKRRNIEVGIERAAARSETG